jgi:hypothetical protein
VSDTNQLKKFRVYYTEYTDGTDYDGKYVSSNKRKSKVVACHRIDVVNVENGSCVLECFNGPESGHEVIAAFRSWDYFLEMK